MKYKHFFTFAILYTIVISCSTHDDFTPLQRSEESAWPDSLQWWKKNNLRLIQTNLPAYEGSLSPDSLLSDLENFSANTLLINAGGIMAFYPTQLEYQYTNPYMSKKMLKDVIEKCHRAGIRVMVRFDFSRAHESIFREHPEWFYISPEGTRINNSGMYTVSINAPYEQKYIFDIVEEVIDRYPIDGLFINMFGYQTWDPYRGIYHGIDQNSYEKKRFSEWSGGLILPVSEDRTDPVLQKYEEFKKITSMELLQRLHDLVKAKNRQIAICTYRDEYVDIIRHETLTGELPYWPYMASDNVNHVETSYPDHIVSNASIQQISFQSRYNAVEPGEEAIRLYENIANGSGLDISLMGDFQDYEDERNYEVIKTVYGFHKKYEPYFGNYTSYAKIAVIAPGYWPGGESMEEYRGIQKMLKEAHLQFDIIEDTQIGKLSDRLQKYKLIILPDITLPGPSSIEAITGALENGTSVIATNRSFSGNPDAMEKLFGAKAIDARYDGGGNYLAPGNRHIFKRLKGQSMIFWKYNLGLYNFDSADTVFLPILSKGRPGPPEMIGGHDPTGYFAAGEKKHGNGKAIMFSGNIGRMYYLLGYEEHKNILLDLVDHVFPDAVDLLQTNAPARVEVILQHYTNNIPENIGKNIPDGALLHLINITGFSGNTYFHPIPVNNLTFGIKTGFKPSGVYSMTLQKSVPFKFEDDRVLLSLDRLDQYEGIILKK